MPLNEHFFGPADTQGHIRAAARTRRIALNLTQSALASRSGVSLACLKRFEQSGEISLTSLLRVASTLDALDGFADLFPLPAPRTLDDIAHPAKPRRRASSRRD